MILPPGGISLHMNYHLTSSIKLRVHIHWSVFMKNVIEWFISLVTFRRHMDFSWISNVRLRSLFQLAVVSSVGHDCFPPATSLDRNQTYFRMNTVIFIAIWTKLKLIMSYTWKVHFSLCKHAVAPSVGTSFIFPLAFCQSRCQKTSFKTNLPSLPYSWNGKSYNISYLSINFQNIIILISYWHN